MIRCLFVVFVLLSSPAFCAPSDWADLAHLDYSIRHQGPNKCALRRNVADALSRVAATYRIDNLSLKVFECYRPQSLGERPGDAPHDRGDAVDLTVVDRLGNEMAMPGPFGKLGFAPKHLKSKAYRRLSDEMKRAGFTPEGPGWWHFVYTASPSPPVDDTPLAAIK